MQPAGQARNDPDPAGSHMTTRGEVEAVWEGTGDANNTACYVYQHAAA